jgi:hypothetical protein
MCPGCGEMVHAELAYEELDDDGEVALSEMLDGTMEWERLPGGRYIGTSVVRCDTASGTYVNERSIAHACRL